MKRQLPPLAAIRAFEAAARLGSLQAASGEISVTPSAVSHQVKSLEDFLGRALFERGPGTVTLTEAGRAYLEELTPILNGLDTATRRVSARETGERFRVLCTPGFAARWLLPRLARCPIGDRIDIAVSEGAPDTDFTRNGADAVIHWGGDPVAGASVEPMMESARYPVAAPGFAKENGLDHPADLLQMTLIHDEVLDGWAAWFRLAGVAATGLPRGPRLPHCELTLSAAERRQGVAMAYDAMARGALRDGLLVRLWDIEVPPALIYSFCRPDSRRTCPTTRLFRDWIFEEVAGEGVAATERLHERAS